MRSFLKASPLARFGWVIPLVVLIFILLLPSLGMGGGVQRQIMLITVYTLMVSGLSLAFGYAGEVILGQVAMMAFGAYATALLAQAGQKDFAVILVVVILMSAVIGLITGLPGLRLSHLSLGLATFFLVMLVPPLAVAFEEYTGGYTGLFGITAPTIFGISLADPDAFFVFCVLITAIWIMIFRNLVLSRYGTALLVLKKSPVLAASLGQSSLRLRLSAYLIAGIPAGVAGALFAYITGYVGPSSFTLTLSVAVLAAAVVGGAQSIYGAAIGATLLVLGPLSSQEFQRYSMLVYGVFLLLVGTVFAIGLAGWGRKGLEWVRSRARARWGAAATLSSGAAAAARDELLASIAGKRLTVSGASRAFGAVKALRGVDFEAQPGRITGLIGANGAGKTTLLNAVSGVITLDEGRVEIEDVEITAQRPAERARSGVGRTFQTPLIPETMSVLEVARSGAMIDGRLMMVSSILRLPRFWRTRRHDTAVALGALDIVGLSDRAESVASSLPLSTRRLLEVVRAVAGRPKVLLLDEPAAGMDDDALGELRDLLLRLRDAGATIVLIEHNISFVLGLADDVYVMELGATLATGTPAAIRSNPAVIASYLGSRHGAADTATPEDVTT
ncbi:ATP-binding cassette domain-containing protein [Microbacterium sp. LWH7-1.2]|uniref:branched-chain amino acid ABC transporter ATP-binding protein/permease n=1 Tax=Microbacterium sp. LWH7-1.2 TaxID=3135257 RepID=UPI003138DCBD